MELNKSVVLLSLSRIADAVANSFLIIILPAYLASGAISMGGVASIRLLSLELTFTEAFLIGVLLTLYGLTSSLFQPIAGWYSDRTSERKSLIIFGLALLSVSIGAYAHLTTYLAILVFRFLQGIGAAFIRPTTVALLNSISDESAKGTNMGLFNVFRFLGYGLGPVLAGGIVDYGPYGVGPIRLSGFEMAFYCAAALAAVSVVLVAVFVEEVEPSESADEAESGSLLSISVFGSDRNSTFDPLFALAVAAFLMAINISLYATLQAPINDRLGQGSMLFGVEFAMVMVALVLFLVPVGYGSDRFGRRPFLLSGFVLLVPTVFVQGIISSPAPMIVARFFQGIAAAMIMAPGLALAGDLATLGREATDLSLLTMAFGLGTALGPFVSGSLAGYGLLAPFAFGATLAAIGFLLVYWQIPEPSDERDDASALGGVQGVSHD